MPLREGRPEVQSIADIARDLEHDDAIARGQRFAQILSEAEPVDPSFWFSDPDKAIQPPITSHITQEQVD